jgi:hypothetical protein
VKWYGKYGKYRRKLWNDMKKKKKGKSNSDKVWKIWKKDKSNSEMIWKIWKKGKSNSDKIWII